jgi:hypothetical protein
VWSWQKWAARPCGRLAREVRYTYIDMSFSALAVDMSEKAGNTGHVRNYCNGFRIPPTQTPHSAGGAHVYLFFFFFFFFFFFGKVEFV